MERDVSVALAQPGGDPSSPAALGPWHALSSRVPVSGGTAGWDSPHEASQVPALQDCGTTAGLPETLPCSPGCCVLTLLGLALEHGAPRAAPAQA